MSKLREEYTRLTSQLAWTNDPNDVEFFQGYVEWLEAKVDFYLDKVKWVDDAVVIRARAYGKTEAMRKQAEETDEAK